MYKSVLFSIFCALFFTACYSRNPDEFTKYYEDGRAKPTIAIASIIDTTTDEYTWSLSDEFENLFLNKIANKGTLYINDFNEHTTYVPSSENPFGIDISWMKKEYEPNEFVVFLELVEHATIPTKKSADGYIDAANLNTAIRIRIVDIRPSKPKIVLQELIKESYPITRAFTEINYDITHWGTKDYNYSPLCLAHTKIMKEVVERVNDYILLAKSRWNG